jgi:hypothetical protein
VRDHCGCLKRIEADRTVLNEAAHQAVFDTAEDFSREWGCPAAGHNPPAALPKHLAPLARNAARVVGLAETPRTCPFACIVAADPWVVEITRAAGIAHDYHTPLDAILQRPLTAADIDALDAMRSGQHDAWTSDRAIEDAERKSRSSP